MANSAIAPSVVPPQSPAKRRRPLWLPPAAALCFALLTAWLGQWQLDRADQKRARQAAWDAATARPVVDLATAGGDWAGLYYRRVRLLGVFEPAHQIYLDNRMHAGRVGYHVLCPLAFGDRAVLVDRGWLAAGLDRSVEPRNPPPAGEVSVAGVLVPASSRYLELAATQAQGRVWQNLDLARYRDWSGRNLANAVILQTSVSADGLGRDWPRPDAGVSRHEGYAVQWFAMTMAIIALYAYHGIWRPRHGPR